MKTVKNILALSIILSLSCFPAQPPAPNVSLPPMAIPSEEEMREAFNQLMNMSEEERKQLETEALNQLSNLSENDLKQIETEMMNRISSLTPEEREELEQRGKEMLMQWGIDPETGKPLEQAKPAEPIEPKKEQPIAQPTPPAASVHTKDYISNLLNQLIQHLKEARHTATHEQLKPSPIETVSADLDQLIRYLTLINQQHHHQRLLDKEYEPLIKNLDKLNNTLQNNQLRINTKEALSKETSQIDPYEILSLPYTATNKEIETSYKQLAEKHDPAKARTRLATQGATEKELEKAEKEARINFNLITDAYESLINAPTRAQVDRERKARQQQQKSFSQEAKKALANSIDAISSAIHQQNVVSKLNEFLQKYEPEQLAQLNAQKAAEEKRKKEHAEAVKTQPIKSPSVPASEPHRRPSHPHNDYDRYQPDRSYNPSVDRGTSRQPARHHEQEEKEKTRSSSKAKKEEDRKDAVKEKELKLKEWELKLKEEEADRKKKEKREEAFKPKNVPAQRPTDNVQPNEKNPSKAPGQPLPQKADQTQPVSQTLHEILTIAEQLSKLPDITSAQELIKNNDSLSEQATLISNYAAQIKKLETALSAIDNNADLMMYKNALKGLNQEEPIQKAHTTINTINDLLKDLETKNETTKTVRDERLVTIKNDIATIEQAMLGINKIINPV